MAWVEGASVADAAIVVDGDEGEGVANLASAVAGSGGPGQGDGAGSVTGSGRGTPDCGAVVIPGLDTAAIATWDRGPLGLNGHSHELGRLLVLADAEVRAQIRARFEVEATARRTGEQLRSALSTAAARLHKLEAAEREVASLRTELSALRQRHATLRAMNERSTALAASAERRVHDLERLVGERDSEAMALAAVRRQMHSLQDAARDAAAARARAEAELAQAQERSSRQVRALTEQLERSKRRIAGLEQRSIIRAPAPFAPPSSSLHDAATASTVDHAPPRGAVADTVPLSVVNKLKGEMGALRARLHALEVENRHLKATAAAGGVPPTHHATPLVSTAAASTTAVAPAAPGSPLVASAAPTTTSASPALAPAVSTTMDGVGASDSVSDGGTGLRADGARPLHTMVGSSRDGAGDDIVSALRQQLEAERASHVQQLRQVSAVVDQLSAEQAVVERTLVRLQAERQDMDTEMEAVMLERDSLLAVLKNIMTHRRRDGGGAPSPAGEGGDGQAASLHALATSVDGGKGHDARPRTGRTSIASVADGGRPKAAAGDVVTPPPTRSTPGSAVAATKPVTGVGTASTNVTPAKSAPRPPLSNAQAGAASTPAPVPPPAATRLAAAVDTMWKSLSAPHTPASGGGATASKTG